MLPVVIPTINEAKFMQAEGPYPTKSNGSLDKLFELTNPEGFILLPLERIPGCINTRPALRKYLVRVPELESVGGKEAHFLRQEVLTVIEGTARIDIKDLFGASAVFVLNSGDSLYIPNLILHTYETLTSKVVIGVLANTSFDASDPETHDTYPSDWFEGQQQASE